MIVAGGVISTGCLLFVAIAALTRLPITDVAIQLHLASETLKGASYGGDLLEINPPLFVWLATPAVILADFADSNLWSVFVLLSVLVTVASGCLVYLVLRQEHPFRAQLAFISVACAALVLPTDFGQREHWVLALLIPYSFLTSQRVAQQPVPASLAVSISVLAATGIALKPQFVAVVVLLEFWLWRVQGIKQSIQRAEPWLIGSVGVTYLVAVKIVAPDYLHFLALHAEPYSAYLRISFATAATQAPLQELILIACSIWVIEKSSPRKRSAQTTALLLVTVGALISAALQQKGFGYHYVPAQGFALLFLCSIAITVSGKSAVVIFPQSGVGRWASLGAIATLVGWYTAEAFHLLVVMGAHDIVSIGRLLTVPLFLLLLRGDGGRTLRIQRASFAVGLLTLGTLLAATAESSFGQWQLGIDPDLPKLLSVIEEVPGRSVAMLSTNPASAWPLMLRSDAEWPFRYSSLAFLAAFYPADEAASIVTRWTPDDQLTTAERSFRETTLQDLTQAPPELIFALSQDAATTRVFGGATRFDFVSYLSQDVRFVELLTRYKETDSVGRYRVFRRMKD